MTNVPDSALDALPHMVKTKIRVRSCLSLCAVLVVLIIVASKAEFENWRKTKFIIYVETSYRRVYQERYGQLPTTLEGFDSFMQTYGKKPDNEADALALQTYRLYHPVMTNVELSLDGKQVKALIRFEGFWVRERDVVLYSKE